MTGATVHPTAVVAPNVRLGEGSIVGEYAILGRAPRGKKDGELELVIGPGAVIRPFTTIYAGTRIGARLQNGQGASIREDNIIGDDVSVGTHASLEFVVVDLRELEEAPGVHAHPRADAIAEFERRVRPDRNVVADDVVLADRGALPGLETRADARPGVDRRERTDHRAGIDDELELALFLAARWPSQDRVLADGAAL